MRTAEQVLERLRRLSATDRAWLLQALSDGAKAQLRQLTAALSEHSSNSFGRPVAAEAAVDLERLVPRLAAEPAWMLALLLMSRPGPWTAQLLARLAPDKRLEVVQLRASLPRMSPAMEEALARSLAEQIAAAPDGPDPSFEEAFERARFGLRSRRRLVEVGT